MTKYLLILWLIIAAPCAQAKWFGGNDDSRDSRLNDYKQRLANAENQLSDQRKMTANWEIAAGALAVGCIALFTIGTAIGARTRVNYILPPPPSVPNGKRTPDVA